MSKDPETNLQDDYIGFALKMIEGKWKLPIMCVLCKEGALRYNELKRKLDITNMMLTSTLKELEADGLVLRTQYNEVPPRVEYSATKKGRRLVPALKEIRLWGEILMNGGDVRSKREDWFRVGLDTLSKPADEVKGAWKFEYEDGSWASGTMVKDTESGKEMEIPRWELINGTWWCFGADGVLKTGLIYDADRQGWFYVDRKTGMKTGWVLVDNQWRYFESMSHSATGRMAVDTWIDGWYVDENGIWDGKDRHGEVDNKDFAEKYQIIKREEQGVNSIAEARMYRNMTQKELAEKTGINQSDISKLEKGMRNPSLAILKRLAEGMDMDLKIEFVPKVIK